jgi:hypothetical protein
MRSSYIDSSEQPGYLNLGVRKKEHRNLTVADSSLRIFLLLFFTFYIHYIPFHLAAELHCEHDPETAHSGNPEHEEHCDDEEHEVHSSTDHEITFVAQKQILLSTPGLFLSSEKISFLPAVPAIRIPVHEEILPGDSPPDPLQPRAPPGA